MNQVLRIVLGLALVYGSLVLIAYLAQARLLFQPDFGGRELERRWTTFSNAVSGRVDRWPGDLAICGNRRGNRFRVGRELVDHRPSF